MVSLGFVKLLLWAFVFTTARGSSLWPPLNRTPIRYEFSLTWETHSPDGFARKMILTNGQFPGPSIEVTQGDEVEVAVTNLMPFNTTIHFHGIDQVGTPWSDGVPGVTQKPISPGATFVYRWTATDYGTYWYHAHERGQLADGLFGAILINPPSSEPSAFKMISNSSYDLAAMRRAENHAKPLIISDWSHLTSEEFWNIEAASDVDVTCMDSILVNGKGSVACLSQEEINKYTPAAAREILTPLGLTFTDKGCLPADVPVAQGNFTHQLNEIPYNVYNGCQNTSAPREVIKVDPKDGWVSINIISTADVSTLEVSIDEHPMWIYATDGRHIEPTLVHAVSVPNGNRYSALVKLDKAPGDYTIRVATVGLNQVLSGYATLSYTGAKKSKRQSTPYIDYAGSNLTEEVVFFSDATQKGFPASSPATTADATHFFEIGHFGGSYLWTLNGKESYGMGFETATPILFNPNSTTPEERNLTITTKNGTWVDLIFKITSLQPPHPVHKHSNKGYIIGQGVGTFNYSSVAEAMQYIPEAFNFNNPPLRDSFTTPPATTEDSWLAVRYQVVNPGPFLLHCHVQTHLSGGMGAIILDAPEDWPAVPSEYRYGNGLF